MKKKILYQKRRNIDKNEKQNWYLDGKTQEWQSWVRHLIVLYAMAVKVDMEI